ncbi:hypothetical protein [Arcobacter sp. CECT 8989]|uniref:hypothetical protein n=1 Tax=Arcobacter sp. CECT 8989 TaxID=2044509 RepID=UPI0013E8FB57|nr:hypothetical protein [Arcobacter sp. CECT 8989]
MDEIEVFKKELAIDHTLFDLDNETVTANLGPNKTQSQKHIDPQAAKNRNESA